jgi:hypothetical protein
MPTNTTVALPEQLTHTVSFSRKVAVRQYESAEATIFIQFSTDRDASAEEIIAGAQETFLQAKGVIYTQLGLDTDLDESGILVELVDRQFGPGVEKVKTAPKRQASTVKADAPSVDGKDVSAPKEVGSNPPAQPPFPGTTRDKDEKRANREWAERRLAHYPDEFFDNRQDKADGKINPKSPDYKHKDSGVGVWLPDAA